MSGSEDDVLLGEEMVRRRPQGGCQVLELQGATDDCSWSAASGSGSVAGHSAFAGPHERSALDTTNLAVQGGAQGFRTRKPQTRH